MRNTVLLACASLLACTDTFHPEYHPVTVTNVEQSTNGSPIVVTPSAPVAVATTRPAPTGVMIYDPSTANPETFFAPRR